MTVVEHPMVIGLRAAARKVALVTTINPHWANVTDEVIVGAICQVAGTPSCFKPNKEATATILGEYRSAKEVLSA